MVHHTFQEPEYETVPHEATISKPSQRASESKRTPSSQALAFIDSNQDSDSLTCLKCGKVCSNGGIFARHVKAKKSCISNSSISKKFKRTSYDTEG